MTITDAHWRLSERKRTTT